MTESAKYKDIRPLIKPGDLIEFAANSIIGKLIRAKTGQNVNHTSGAVWLSARVLNQNAYLQPRLYIYEAISNGFRLTYLSKELEGYDGKVYWVPLNAEYDDFRPKIIKKAEDLDGRPYDYASLFLNLLRRVPLNADKPYCSEAFHIIYRYVGLIPYDFSPTGKPKDAGCGLRPGEFWRTGLFEEPILILP